MRRNLELREDFDPPTEVVEAAKGGNLVLFVGAGVSMLQGMPSWQGFADQALESLRSEGALNYSEIDQLPSLDPRKQLSIASLIAKGNQVPLDLCQPFKDATEARFALQPTTTTFLNLGSQAGQVFVKDIRCSTIALLLF